MKAFYLQNFTTHWMSIIRKSGNVKFDVIFIVLKR